MPGAGPFEVRRGRAADLRRVHRAYVQCFDQMQQLRTVAYSPILFRLYHRYLLLRGRCEIVVAQRDSELAGFAIVRQQGKSEDPWLLSAIGVVPQARGAGLARKLFEAAARRPLVLSVEEQGPVGFYRSLGAKETGARTLLYLKRENLEALSTLATGPEQPVEVAALNRRASLVRSRSVSAAVVRAVRGRLRYFQWAIVETEGRSAFPAGAFPLVIHELEFRYDPAPAL